MKRRYFPPLRRRLLRAAGGRFSARKSSESGQGASPGSCSIGSSPAAAKWALASDHCPRDMAAWPARTRPAHRLLEGIGAAANTLRGLLRHGSAAPRYRKPPRISLRGRGGALTAVARPPSSAGVSSISRARSQADVGRAWIGSSANQAPQVVGKGRSSWRASCTRAIFPGHAETNRPPDRDRPGG